MVKGVALSLLLLAADPCSGPPPACISTPPASCTLWPCSANSCPSTNTVSSDETQCGSPDLFQCLITANHNHGCCCSQAGGQCASGSDCCNGDCVITTQGPDLGTYGYCRTSIGGGRNMSPGTGMTIHVDSCATEADCEGFVCCRGQCSLYCDTLPVIPDAGPDADGGSPDDAAPVDAPEDPWLPPPPS